MHQQLNLLAFVMYMIDVQAIEEALTPRLTLTGEMSTLNKFKEFFHGKSLDKSTNILLLWKTNGVLDVDSTSSAPQDYSQACDASVRITLRAN